MLRILFVDKAAAPFSIARQTLEAAGIQFSWENAATRDEFIRALEVFSPELIISDYALPRFEAMAALQDSQARNPSIPLIFFTDPTDEETAVACMKAGAADYILKNHPERLPEAVRAALEKKTALLDKNTFENARRNSISRFGTLMENFNGMIYRCRNDALWTVQYASPGVEQLTGYKASDLVNNRHIAYAHLIHPDDRDPVRDTVQKALKRGNSFTCQYRIRDIHGFEKWVLEQGHGVPSGDGPIETIEGLISDITVHKKTEHALLENERKYRFLAENISDIVFTCDEKGNYTYISPSHKQLLGRGKEVIGRSVLEHVHPDDLAPMRQLFSEAFVKGIQARGMYRYSHPTRGYIWLESSGQRHMDANLSPQAIITSRDISERKWAEEALKISEAKFRSIFDFSYQAIALSEAETGRLAEVNNKLCELTGYTRQELIGRTTTELNFYTAADRKRFIRELADAGEVQGLEMDFKAKDGSMLNSLMFARTMEINHRPYILTLFLNITEQKQMEAQLLQSQKMEAVGRLAGGVAHDFNNMLSVILGYTEMSLSALPADSGLHQNLHEIHQAARRSSSLVRQLLAFSRRQAVEPRSIHLNQAIREHKRMLDRLIGENISISFQAGKAVWPILMDPAQLDQILANLAVNARDAISQVGNVDIATANITLDRNFRHPFNEVKPGDYVLLSFSDDGQGMEAKTLKQIFEPFFTTKAKGQGTGLGLATIYGIVRQNQGLITVESEPGKGTTFKLYFPRFDGERSPTDQPPISAELSGNETILLVEDQKQVMELARMMLEMRGYSIHCALTPAAALAICRKTPDPIHLLLTDVIMPEMNGKELKNQVQALKPGIRTLFMSGHTEDVIARNGILDEGVAFLQKPFSSEELAKKVRLILDQ